MGLNCVNPRMCGFFSVANTTVFRDPCWLNPRIWGKLVSGGLTISYRWIWDCVEGWPPNPCVVQESAVVLAIIKPGSVCIKRK